MVVAIRPLHKLAPSIRFSGDLSVLEIFTNNAEKDNLQNRDTHRPSRPSIRMRLSFEVVDA